MKASPADLAFPIARLAAVDSLIERLERLVVDHQTLRGDHAERGLKTYSGCLAVLQQYRHLALKLSARAGSERNRRLSD